MLKNLRSVLSGGSLPALTPFDTAFNSDWFAGLNVDSKLRIVPDDVHPHATFSSPPRTV